jgi:starch-binding outer membrane protein, SusD/RagB family
MKLKTLRLALLLVTAAGCNTILDVAPINQVPEETAIVSPATARAAVAGMYDGLQSTNYYGGTFLHFGDLSAEDVEHTGTFTTYREVDQNSITADNSSIEGVWDALYRAIGRANIVILKVPTVSGLDPVERDQMLGEAHFIRALTYHNLVKYWGDTAAAGLGVPIVLVPPPDIPSSANVSRQTTGEVYTQILSDLSQAETLMSFVDSTRRASIGVVRAIRARVLLYQRNWAAAEAEAQAVAAMGYTLAPLYSDLFTPEGDDTPEDIFRVNFTATEFNLLGFYYRAKGLAAGRREITPSNILIRTYDSDSNFNGTPASYNPIDKRGQWNVAFQGTTKYGSKYPTSVGAEDLHAIRFAEILLIEAEAEARQNKLAEAEASIAPIRTRAGLPALRVDLMTQADAITAILKERRLELAYEGDRWPDLVRTGLAVSTLNLVGKEFQALYPIPLNEIDVTVPPLVQNTGY